MRRRCQGASSPGLQHTANSKRGAVSVLQRNSQARLDRGVCWESGGQPAKQGGPEQRQGLDFVLSAEESHLRGFVC